ncbi:AAA family ATPase [Sulfobacillus harzensis]|uniref:MoxR family ATPase n=1 Tax=Sulfobacillus harzensis TaxID=2729629 RepID=A0A7Y0Q4H6_9FIRM|nr:MoxR family ATPase [Sulfobacillus harzensis]NMP24031.1 MoxR family ATPase [Sulfobacillus harzensis]
MQTHVQSPADWARSLAAQHYLADRDLAVAAYLALKLERPLLLEGEPGVGKTEFAKAAALALGRPLIRLQCFYGIDAKSAVYDWNYARQMIAIRLAEGDSAPRVTADDVYGRDFLIARPLLEALTQVPAPVLLIDEVDRTDEAFEALLLEFLGEYQVTVPEIGTIRGEEIPLVVLTSNRTREIHDALRRRCLYAWIGYPSLQRERAILEERVPGLGEDLSSAITAFVARLREEPLVKRPGVAETIAWAEALKALEAKVLTPELVESTLGLLLKYYDDVEMLRRPHGGGMTSSLVQWLEESRMGVNGR